MIIRPIESKYPERQKIMKLVREIPLSGGMEKLKNYKALQEMAKNPFLNTPVGLRTKGVVLQTLAKYELEMLKLKANVECWKEQNMAALGLEGPTTTINLINMTVDELREGLPNALLPNVLPAEEVTVQADITTVEKKLDSIQIIPGLYVGDKHSCAFNSEGWAVIHACKSHHQIALGYKGSLDSSHPSYLTHQTNNHLYLNLIDPDKPLFQLEPFVKGLKFLLKWFKEKKLPTLVHCDQGESRAPSLVLLYLALTKQIPNGGYSFAKKPFEELYPKYKPGNGIQIWLSDPANWTKLMSVDK